MQRHLDDFKGGSTFADDLLHNKFLLRAASTATYTIDFLNHVLKFDSKLILLQEKTHNGPRDTVGQLPWLKQS